MHKVKNLHKQVSALVWKEGRIFVAKGVEVEVASQGSTKKKALENLKEALELYFEDENQIKIPQNKQVSLETVEFYSA